MKAPIDTIYEQVEAERLLEVTLARINARVFGFTLGGLTALGLFVATLILLIQSGPQMGKHLNLLGHFYPGFSVSPLGLALALLYGWITGFAVGYFLSRVYNWVSGMRRSAAGSL